jgi:hypothetical protein
LPVSATGPSLIVKAKPSGQIVVWAFADLDAPGKHRVILAAFVVPALIGFDCKPEG